mgnify:CR=1 FL=1
MHTTIKFLSIISSTSYKNGVTMVYLNTRHIAAIAMCAALWGVVNAYIAPIFWNATHMPFFCDMLGIILLTLILWWTRKLGAATITGIITTIITLILNPYATQSLAFIATSIVFDILTRLIGYQNCLDKPLSSIVSLLFISVVSTAVAGVIIGNLFMNPNLLTTMFGGVTFFAALHAVGGVIGSTIGLVLVRALSTRITTPKV